MTDEVGAMHPGDVRWRRYGPAAWLIENVTNPAAWSDALQTLRVDGIVEIVPAETTVVVVCERTAADMVSRSFGDVQPNATLDSAKPVVTIEVTYDGIDLDEVANLCELTVDEVITRHVAGRYHVAFCGFAPGFAYLRGLDPALHAPRRESPRTRVPAGSVAVAAGYTSVYPSVSPGGWQILGTTSTRVWDLGRREPALLVPGTDVRFREVGR